MTHSVLNASPHDQTARPSLLDHVRAAVRGLRSGRTYADGYSLGLTHRDEDDAIVDQALARFAVDTATTALTPAAFDDKLADVLAVRAIHARRPHLTLVGGAR